MSEASGERSFLAELKRRRVIRVATLYVVAFWPIIQIVDILSPAIDIPPSAMRYMLIAFVAGLPVVLLLAWLYDLNRDGLVRTADADEGEATSKPLIGRGVELALLSVLLLIVAALFYFQSNLTFEDSPTQPLVAAPSADTYSIAVLPFVSFSTQREDGSFPDPAKVNSGASHIIAAFNQKAAKEYEDQETERHLPATIQTTAFRTLTLLIPQGNLKIFTSTEP